ncbi:hypothetical protein VI06_16330 [Aquitalea magnusonii]|nr:hypothetical protein VI06_16330 [Aquitalea magnusonii]
MDVLQVAQGELQAAILLAKEISGLTSSAAEKMRLELLETLLRDVYQQLDDAQHQINVIERHDRISLI